MFFYHASDIWIAKPTRPLVASLIDSYCSILVIYPLRSLWQLNCGVLHFRHSHSAMVQRDSFQSSFPVRLKGGEGRGNFNCPVCCSWRFVFGAVLGSATWFWPWIKERGCRNFWFLLRVSGKSNLLFDDWVEAVGFDSFEAKSTLSCCGWCDVLKTIFGSLSLNTVKRSICATWFWL